MADADAAVLISYNVASTPFDLPPKPSPDGGARNRDPIPDTLQPSARDGGPISDTQIPSHPVSV